jgi:hypothetical protein
MLEKTKVITTSVGYCVLVFVVGFICGTRYITLQNKQQEFENKTIVCPSLLSKDRSARDTLITMKMIPLCNGYVLDNLQ